MSEVIQASDQPYVFEVEKDKTYFWCACGRSKNQPFCDGSHKGTGISPVRYQAASTRKVFFCGCKSSNAAPLCDGTHNNL